jgi:hypothetical protein
MCRGGDITKVHLSDNRLKGVISSAIGKLTELTKLWLNSNQLTNTIPSQLVRLTELAGFSLNANQLTGAVPSLPFKQYTSNCCLYKGVHTNRFTCPLPAGAADCKCVGQPGVACNESSHWQALRWSCNRRHWCMHCGASSSIVKDTPQAASANCTRSGTCSCASDYVLCEMLG